MKWLAILAAAGFVAVFALVAGAAEYYQARGLEPARATRADVVVVLSAGLSRETAALDAFSQARVAAGVDLWRAGVAPAILMSGGPSPATGQHLAEAMKREAIALGAPEWAIYVEGNSISTFENTRFTMQVARLEGWRRAVVVSDDFHLLRAAALYRFWAGRDGLEIAELAAAHGRGEVGLLRAATALGRETLALPYNLGKIAGQVALEAFGLGDDGMIR